MWTIFQVWLHFVVWFLPLSYRFGLNKRHPEWVGELSSDQSGPGSSKSRQMPSLQGKVNQVKDIPPQVSDTWMGMGANSPFPVANTERPCSVLVSLGSRLSKNFGSRREAFPGPVSPSLPHKNGPETQTSINLQRVWLLWALAHCGIALGPLFLNNSTTWRLSSKWNPSKWLQSECVSLQIPLKLGKITGVSPAEAPHLISLEVFVSQKTIETRNLQRTRYSESWPENTRTLSGFWLPRTLSKTHRRLSTWYESRFLRLLFSSRKQIENEGWNYTTWATTEYESLKELLPPSGLRNHVFKSPSTFPDSSLFSKNGGSA